MLKFTEKLKIPYFAIMEHSRTSICAPTYAKVIDTKVSIEMSALQEKLLDRSKEEEDTGNMKIMRLFK